MRAPSSSAASRRSAPTSASRPTSTRPCSRWRSRRTSSPRPSTSSRRWIREPRFDGDELRKLKARTTDEAEDAARSSGAWTATRVVFRELFPEKSAYATYGLVPSEIARVDGADHPRLPSALLRAEGHDPGARRRRRRGDGAVARGAHFGAGRAASRRRSSSRRRALPRKRRVVVAHRPKSVQSDVYVAMIAPPRKAPRTGRPSASPTRCSAAASRAASSPTCASSGRSPTARAPRSSSWRTASSRSSCTPAPRREDRPGGRRAARERRAHDELAADGRRDGERPALHQRRLRGAHGVRSAPSPTWS